MDIAFAIFSLGKMGGQERHCVQLAETLAGRGHSVAIYTTAPGTISGDIPLRLIRPRGRANHSRMAAFAEDVRLATADRCDLIVACQKLPGADILFCADWSLAARKLPPWKRLLPRYRTFIQMERACCGPSSDMFLIMFGDAQARAYRDVWSIAPERMMILPPTLHPAMVHEAPGAEERAGWRQSLGIEADQTTWLWVGLQPKVKGLDRAIEALALSRNSVLLAAGADPGSRAVRALVRKAERLDCAGRLRLTGLLSSDELARLYLTADLLVHPSRLDVTGTVIVEALGAGLPVIATENCGYSNHIRAAAAGVVLPEAVTPAETAGACSVSADTLRLWADNARRYVRTNDLTGGIAAAADAIEARAPGT
ncbi:MAG: glycosyltransferase family 4 protein [Xanthobacteraceae bacterium]